MLEHVVLIYFFENLHVGVLLSLVSASNLDILELGPIFIDDMELKHTCRGTTQSNIGDY